ncbi:MAG TPA: NAD(P)-dependent oxidoreductase [Candidatus Saccharimonadales bacterium]|nr:NAD(P)-dependent oxidoreductase [Candidatus Saccharimonadales bacterium]
MKTKFKNILITGGAGYVGTVLTELLLKEGYTVRVFDSISEMNLHPLPFGNSKKFEFVKGDIREKSDVKKALKGMDAVIHLAGIVGYPACEKEPELSHQVNVIGTKNVMSAAKGELPILFASTTSVYGKITDDICTEATARNPLSRYGKQKVEAEDLVKKNKKFIIFRFTTGFGASIKMRFDTLPNDFTYKALKEGKIVIYQKNFIRSFIYVKDMARAFLFGLEHFDTMNGEVYNVGNNDLNISKEELGLLVQKKTKCKLEFKEIGKDLEGRDYYVSFDKIAKTGYKTKMSIEDGVDELINVISHL